MPKPPAALPTRKYLEQCFSYNRQTGELKRRSRPRTHFSTLRGWQTAAGREGRNAVILNGGDPQPRVFLDGRKYSAAQIIWKLVTGEDPRVCLRYSDHDPTNLRFENLQLAEPADV